VLAVDTRFWDIGTVADYLDTSRQLSTPADGHQRAGATIAPDATVTGSILWDDITVGAGASIERCIITDGVQVPAGAVYRDCILMTSGNGIDALPLDRA
jgi:NDP-sugar pyrophosphorylase family protein